MNQIKTPSLSIVAFIIILLLGVGLRLHAFQANTRAYGDVNTIRSSARQYTLTGIVQYPWKLERFESTLDDPLATPAYMHGPTLPFLAGTLSRLLGIDTFTSLKSLTLIAGIAMVILSYWLGTRVHSSLAGLLAMLCVSTSPVLVDFSANGSPYIIAATLMLLADNLLVSFNPQRLRDYAGLGVICCLAFLSLQAMLALTAAILLIGLIFIRRLRVWGIIIFVGTWLLCYIPALMWYITYFNRPFISQQTNYIATELALMGTERAAFINQPLTLFSEPLFSRYIDVMWSRFLVYLENLTFELSLPVLYLAIASVFITLIFPRLRKIMGYVGVTRLVYLAFTSAGLALLHMRFLVPVVSGILVLVPVIWVSISSKRPRFLMGILSFIVVLYAGWSIWSYLTLDTPPTRYYRDESSINLEYDASQDIGKQLSVYPIGNVVGCEDARRAIYHTLARLVITQCDPDLPRIQQILENTTLNVRYGIYQIEVIQRLQAEFPNAKIITQNTVLGVLDFTP